MITHKIVIDEGSSLPLHYRTRSASSFALRLRGHTGCPEMPSFFLSRDTVIYAEMVRTKRGASCLWGVRPMESHGSRV